MPGVTTHPASGDDVLLGRAPGLLPPVRPAVPLLWLAALLLLLTFLVVALVRPSGPLDQADVAQQRDGLVDDGPVVPDEVAGVAFGERLVVLLFERQTPDPDAVRDWRAELSADYDVRLVLPGPADQPMPVPVVADSRAALAEAVDLPTPNDGGRGIGYAVVDGDRVVRYSTLDPSWPENAFEVATIAGSVA
jgi:hypothetical protein